MTGVQTCALPIYLPWGNFNQQWGNFSSNLPWANLYSDLPWGNLYNNPTWGNFNQQWGNLSSDLPWGNFPSRWTNYYIPSWGNFSSNVPWADLFSNPPWNYQPAGGNLMQYLNNIQSQIYDSFGNRITFSNYQPGEILHKALGMRDK